MRVFCLLLTFFLAVAGAVCSSESDPPAFHADAEALEGAALDAMRGLLRDDAPAARKALDRVEELCRRAVRSDSDWLGMPLIRLDQALHAALDRARESAGSGDTDRAFDDYVWVQRTCRQCHAAARDAAPSE